MKKKFFGFAMAGVMTAALLSGCGAGGSGAAGGDAGAEGAGSSSAEAQTEAPTGGSDNAAAGGSYKFAANIWGTGAYPLDIIVHADEKAAAVAGVELDVADNQFTADKIITDLQGQLSSQPDGVIMFSVVDTVFGQVQSLCDAQNVPYVLDTNFPSDESVFNAIKEDPLFIGGVAASPYEMGKTMAEEALADGNKTAIVLGAAIGDYSHDQRIDGFTKTFEEGGGKVLQTMHCSDPSESTTKANDLMTANQGVDCAYASGGDYLSALAAIKDGDKSVETKLYGTDVAPDLISYIQSGVISAMNGGNHVNGAITLCLLTNYLDGHQILDENGKAPILDYLSTYTITADNADHYAKLYENESCFITDEQFESLLYRTNPDVSLQTYDEFLKSYASTIEAIDTK